MMILYGTGALLVGGILVHAFLKDSTTPKTDRLSWLVILLASAFWPLVLPSILRKKLGQSPSPLKAQWSA
ncbi:MAG: hypothetical protein MUF72_15090 [Elainella sp. Prado103]|jgi:hypothetical protein|nr:hypothetical protein [Elainella sp. Prado103]